MQRSKELETIKARARKVMMKPPTDPKDMKQYILSTAVPIFGGTTPPIETAETPPIDPATETTPKTETKTETETTEDSIKKLQNDPSAISQLLSQLEQANRNIAKITGERDQYLTKQQQTERAQMNKEQQLQSDLDNAMNQIEQLDRVVQQMAVTNSFLSQGDYQWNSIRQAMSELKDEDYDVEIDLANGNATVTGMEAAVKRIAQSSPWLLKAKADTRNSEGGGTRQRGSGSPPAPPSGNQDKVDKRNSLIKKFPVIATGR